MVGSVGGTGPVSPELREQWRRERRIIIRRHHPDVGGDPELLQRLLRENDARYRRREQSPGPAGRPAARQTPFVRRVIHAVRASLPRGWPGRRRYFDL